VQRDLTPAEYKALPQADASDQFPASIFLNLRMLVSDYSAGIIEVKDTATVTEKANAKSKQRENKIKQHELIKQLRQAEGLGRGRLSLVAFVLGLAALKKWQKSELNLERALKRKGKRKNKRKSEHRRLDDRVRKWRRDNKGRRIPVPERLYALRRLHSPGQADRYEAYIALGYAIEVGRPWHSALLWAECREALLLHAYGRPRGDKATDLFFNSKVNAIRVRLSRYAKSPSNRAALALRAQNFFSIFREALKHRVPVREGLRYWEWG